MMSKTAELNFDNEQQRKKNDFRIVAELFIFICQMYVS